MKLLRNLLFTCLCVLPALGIAAPLVNINTADSEVLVDELVGIGPQKAMEIIRYRQQNGPFTQIEDMALVKGIGVKTVELNRNRMTVEQAESAQ